MKERKYIVSVTPSATKRFEKLPKGAIPNMSKILDKLEINPYLGKQIDSRLWEQRSTSFRLYYTILEDINIEEFNLIGNYVILLDWSKKNNQQKRIDRLKIIFKEKQWFVKLLKKLKT